MNKFQKNTINYPNIKAIRSYKFKYRDREDTDYCLQLLSKAIKGRGHSSTAEGFLRSYHEGNPDTAGIKRFFTDGCFWAWDQYEPYEYEEFSKYVPDAKVLDEIAKAVIEFDKNNYNRINNVISKFAKFKLKLDHLELNYENIDQYLIQFKLIETDRVTLDLHLELHLEIKNDDLNLSLINFDYHDGPEYRGPYDSGLKKWLTSIAHFNFIPNSKLTLDNADLISRLLSDFIPKLSDAITYKSAFGIIKKYAYSDPKSNVSFKIQYKIEYPDHVIVHDYLSDSLDD